MKLMLNLSFSLAQADEKQKAKTCHSVGFFLSVAVNTRDN
jgi:hypothetical protein